MRKRNVKGKPVLQLISINNYYAKRLCGTHIQVIDIKRFEKSVQNENPFLKTDEPIERLR